MHELKYLSDQVKGNEASKCALLFLHVELLMTPQHCSSHRQRTPPLAPYTLPRHSPLHCSTQKTRSLLQRTRTCWFTYTTQICRFVPLKMLHNFGCVFSHIKCVLMTGRILLGLNETVCMRLCKWDYLSLSTPNNGRHWHTTLEWWSENEGWNDRAKGGKRCNAREVDNPAERAKDRALESRDKASR